MPILELHTNRSYQLGPEQMAISTAQILNVDYNINNVELKVNLSAARAKTDVCAYTIFTHLYVHMLA